MFNGYKNKVVLIDLHNVFFYLYNEYGYNEFEATVYIEESLRDIVNFNNYVLNDIAELVFKEINKFDILNNYKIEEFSVFYNFIILFCYLKK